MISALHCGWLVLKYYQLASMLPVSHSSLPTISSHNVTQLQIPPFRDHMQMTCFATGRCYQGTYAFLGRQKNESVSESEKYTKLYSNSLSFIRKAWLLPSGVCDALWHVQTPGEHTVPGPIGQPADRPDSDRESVWRKRRSEGPPGFKRQRKCSEGALFLWDFFVNLYKS